MLIKAATYSFILKISEKYFKNIIDEHIIGNGQHRPIMFVFQSSGTFLYDLLIKIKMKINSIKKEMLLPRAIPLRPIPNFKRMILRLIFIKSTKTATDDAFNCQLLAIIIPLAGYDMIKK